MPWCEQNQPNSNTSIKVILIILNKSKLSLEKKGIVNGLNSISMSDYVFEGFRRHDWSLISFYMIFQKIVSQKPNDDSIYPIKELGLLFFHASQGDAIPGWSLCWNTFKIISLKLHPTLFTLSQSWFTNDKLISFLLSLRCARGPSSIKLPRWSNDSFFPEFLELADY